MPPNAEETFMQILIEVTDQVRQEYKIDKKVLFTGFDSSST